MRAARERQVQAAVGRERRAIGAVQRRVGADSNDAGPLVDRHVRLRGTPRVSYFPVRAAHAASLQAACSMGLGDWHPGAAVEFKG